MCASHHHLDDFFISLHSCIFFEEVVVDAHFAEFILNHRQFLAVLLREDVV